MANNGERKIAALLRGAVLKRVGETDGRKGGLSAVHHPPQLSFTSPSSSLLFSSQLPNQTRGNDCAKGPKIKVQSEYNRISTKRKRKKFKIVLDLHFTELKDGIPLPPTGVSVRFNSRLTKMKKNRQKKFNGTGMVQLTVGNKAGPGQR